MGIDLPVCPEDIYDILQKVIEQEKIKNPQIAISSGSKVGEGYLGINCSVEIKGENRTLDLFIKSAPKLPKLRAKTQVKLAYQNEYRFYNNVYPVFEDFYKNKTGNSLEFIPKFYAGSVEEMKEIFVLENLKAAGFEMSEAKNTFDANQLRLIMKEYGRFHGVSFALKDQNKEVFSNLSEDLSDFFYLIFDSLGLSQRLKMKCKSMEKYLQSPDDAILLEKVKYIGENVEALISKFNDFKGEHRVILHGDCNHNNLMFNKQENSLDLRLLDFQALRCNSPVLDLSYLIYATASSEENLERLEYFLETYYASLSGTIKDLGSDPDKVCPMSVIKEHWNTFSVFGLIMAILIISTKLSDKAADIVQIATNSNDNISLRTLADEGEYARRIKYLLKHFVDNKFI